MSRYQLPPIRQTPGYSHAVIGNMGTGKSNEMHRLAGAPNRRKEGVLFFFPGVAERDKKVVPASRINSMYPGTIIVTNPDEMATQIAHSTALNVFADEQHFWEQNPEHVAAFIELVDAVVWSGRRFYWSALTKDFRGDPWQMVMRLVIDADRVTKFDTTCAVCGEAPADIPQRLSFGQPVPRNHPRFLTDSVEANALGLTYEARCRGCHQCPDDWNDMSKAIQAQIDAARQQGRDEALGRSAPESA